MRRLLYGSCRFGIAIIMAIIFIYIPIVNAQAATIYVPDDYPTIQQAVDAALPGDTIIVRDGTYVENIFVHTPNLTIKSESGPENCIVQSPDKWVPFVVGVDYTIISGFTIENGSAGITFESASHCNVSNNHITRNHIGIDIWGNSTDNSITFNRIYENEIGMSLFSSHHNFIYLNDFFNNTWNIDSWDSINIWNSPEPVSYIYAGSEYTGLLGNYWDDYTGMYLDGDGIGDESYNISDGEIDYFPLIAPFENYQIYGVAPPFIIIIGNNEFTPENRVSGGSGTESDPYIIEGLEIDAKGGEYGIWIQDTDAYFIIRNCIIKNTTDYGEGIYFNNVTNGRVENNTVLNNYYGIYLYKSSDNILINNTALDNSNAGIYLAYSSNNILTNNNISNNSWQGIILSDSSNNIITNNTVLNNWQGIRLIDSIHNSIINNTAKDNWEYDIGVSPFELDTACDNIVENNIGSGDRPIKYFNHSVNLQDEILSELILCNADNSHISNVTIRGSEVVNNNGLTLVMTDNSTFENVYSYNNYYGIYLRDSTNNTIRESIFANNKYGINLVSRTRLIENNRIYNNIFNNENNYQTGIWAPGLKIWIWNRSGINIWNTTKVPGTNILGGNYLGGNAWLHPNGTGFSRTCSDINDDGICDSAYILDENNTDYLPLTGKMPLFVPDYYPKIQWAIDNATDGDTIIVRNGTYVENVKINKRLTIRSENGPANCVVQAADPQWNVFEVTADYVNITGFTVTGAYRQWSAGIFLDNSDYCNISDNNIMNNYYGIRFYSNSNNNTIINNNITNDVYLYSSNNNIIVNNNIKEVYLESSFNNNIINNNITDSISHFSSDYNIIRDNNVNYIHLYSSNNSIVQDNTVGNSYDGILIQYSSNNSIIGNNVSNCGWGISLSSSSNNIITGNNIRNNNQGIDIDSNNNTITNNKVNDNERGIWLRYSSDNILTNNTIINNTYYGIAFSNCNENIIEYNIINLNEKGIHIFSSNNIDIINNRFANNKYEGIYLSASNNSIIVNNIISSNKYGIKIEESSSNNIINNTIVSNKDYGIYSYSYSSNNSIYFNNFIRNNNGSVQAYDAGTNNRWNSTNLGNYWSDYTTRYPLATNDGTVWDTPYAIDGPAGAADNFPAVHPVAGVFVLRITPNYGPNIITINATIHGVGFTEGMDVRLVREGEEDIQGEDIEVVNESQLTAKFNLSGRAKGLWDVVVRLPSGIESRRIKAFEVRGFVYGIFPNHGFNVTKDQLVTIYGFGFTEGVDVKLTRKGEKDIMGKDIIVLDKNGFTTKFNLTGRTTGLWDLVVTLPTGEQDSLTNAFEILGAAGEGYLLRNITIEAGESQEYEIEVPETHNLFITLQKNPHVKYWNGSLRLSLLKNGTEIASTSGIYHDLILHVVDPEPGLYIVKIEAYQPERGILTVRTTLPELPLGEWVVGTIYNSEGSVWYQVEVPPDQDTLYFEAEAMGVGSHFDIYYEEYGSRDHWISASGPRTSIEIPNPAPGTYIVEFTDSAIIMPRKGGGWWAKDQTRDVLIKADTTFSVEPPPEYLPTITSISPDRGGNAGFVTVEIKGGWLDPNATVSLVRSGYENITAQSVYGSNGTFLTATFNLIGKEPGEWNLVVTNPNGRKVTAPSTFTIEEGGKPELWVEIVGREKIRWGRQSQYILKYGNSGNVDMPAPLFNISTSAPFPLSVYVLPFKGPFIKILGKGPDGNPGILPAGSSYSVPFFIWTGDEGEFSLQVSAITTSSIFEISELANFIDAFCPAPGIPLGFSRVYSNSNYVGPLGRGWIHNYDYRLEELNDGNVALLRGDNYINFFLKGSDNNYTAIRGYSILKHNPDGTYTLIRKDGTIYGFMDNLKLDYIEDPNGNVIDCVYSGNKLVELRHSCGENFTLEYDGDRIIRITDQAGRVTEYHYDGSGKLLTSVKTPDGSVTSYNYGENDKLTSISYPSGVKQFFEYDANGHLSKVYLNDKEEMVRYTYDIANGNTYITDADGNTRAIRVDDFGRIIGMVNPFGASIHYEYDDNDNLIRLTDPLGNSYNFEYDEHGNLVSNTNPLNHTITMEYEPAFNKPIWVKDARGNKISFEYDEHGNIIRVTYPDSNKESMSYDSAGNPTNLTTRKGDLINYTYNNRGQLVRKEYPDGSWVAYEYDDAGNMISATDKHGRIEMEYNVRNQLTKITYPTGQFFNYSYDSGGRLIKREDQDGNVLNYEYDDAGRLVRIFDNNNSDIVHYEYDKVGRISKKILDNGAYTTYEYDAAGRILHLVNYNASGSVLSRFDYTYDLAGNPVSVTTLEGTYRYEYDNIGQLTKVTYPDGHYVSYFYDAAGNRIAVIEDGKTTNYTTNNMNQYTKVGNISYSYDANGNLISKIENGQTTTYEYDFENRLVKVTSPEGAWEHIYDALGNRIGVIHNGTERKYLVDPLGIGDVVAEYDGSGNLVARYIHGLGLISQIDGNGNQYYYHFNPIGHTTEITDENGNVVNRYKYSPFGEYLEKKESIPNPFTFVGEFGVMDDGNGLNYMRMRYYSPEIGRFLSEDPIGLAGGDVNLYNYCGNSPPNRADPLGMQGWEWTPMYHRPGNWRDVIQAYIKIQSSRWESYNYHAEEGYLNLQDALAFWSGKLRDPSPLFSPSFYRAIYHEAYAALLLLSQTVGTVTDWIPAMYYGLKPKPESYGWAKPDTRSKTAEKQIQSVSSSTPEDKYGPTGFDLPGTSPEERKRFISADKNLYYQIDFWNKENATAPACDVFVTDQLDPNLDWNTFRFEEIGFLNWTVKLEPSQYFNIYVDTRPEMNLIVSVEGTFDPETGVINWTFRSLDPETLETPEDPMAGFLPPITESGYEIGWVAFSAYPKDGLPSGTQIENQAYVEFDWAGDLLEHPAPKEGPWVNTIDALPPASTVTAEVIDDYNIQLSWTGEDDQNGSGIRDYTIYVSVDGGDYLPYLTHTTNNSTVFTGEPGHTYTFYSIARDNVGNIEGVPEEPDATVVFENEAPSANPNGPYTGIEGQTVEFNASLSYDPEGMPLTYYWEFGDGETAATNQPTITHIYAQEGNYTVTLIVNDSVQNSTPSITYALINDTEPKASFTANITSGFAPLTVQFNDSSVSYDGIIAWEWDFNGDGIIDSNEQNPTHTYDEAGTYTVLLTVYEADGDSDTETKTDYITVTSAVDTEPPTIESVTLDTYINIPNSTFHVTVKANDNVGIASVTADGINLTKKDNIWEGDIYIPPETHEGKYNITIIAEDDAGNFNKTTVYYSVVIPTGGLGVAILPKISSASPGSEMKLDINVVSTENFDDIVHINLTLEGILTDFQANLSWFNWTNKTVMIPIEGEIVLPIAIEIPNGTSPGYKSFGVYVESKRWHSSAQDYGAIMVG